MRGVKPRGARSRGPPRRRARSRSRGGRGRRAPGPLAASSSGASPRRSSSSSARSSCSPRPSPASAASIRSRVDAARRERLADPLRAPAAQLALVLGEAAREALVVELARSRSGGSTAASISAGAKPRSRQPGAELGAVRSLRASASSARSKASPRPRRLRAGGAGHARDPLRRPCASGSRGGLLGLGLRLGLRDRPRRRRRPLDPELVEQLRLDLVAPARGSRPGTAWCCCAPGRGAARRRRRTSPTSGPGRARAPRSSRQPSCEMPDAVLDVELGLPERRRDLVLDDLDPDPVADRLGALLEGLDAADVEPLRAVELQRPAARLGLRASRT